MEMLKVFLETADRGRVGTFAIPPFLRLPELVIWGSRFFVRAGPKDGVAKEGETPVYREGMPFVVFGMPDELAHEPPLAPGKFVSHPGEVTREDMLQAVAELEGTPAYGDVCKLLRKVCDEVLLRRVSAKKPLMVLVSGGKLTGESAERIEEYLRSNTRPSRAAVLDLVNTEPAGALVEVKAVEQGPGSVLVIEGEGLAQRPTR